MKSCRSAREVRMIWTLRSASQRASAVRSARYAASVFGDRPRSIQTASRKRDTAGSAESVLAVTAMAVFDKPDLAGELSSTVALLQQPWSFGLPDNVGPQYGERGPGIDVTTFTSALQH